ncbi:hypothetical protein MMSR116_11070 [Methylobacterium mesophilicum SR1.6/6]|uniref:Uncharacterized protein n=1 Tax=Methylobacterium mesophilicum SR1.6/6 TaxID=908290 RepID=A0A6B9FMM9_9HYPH|nr:hypothetical protein [Methylobacterium mesophilicum]QGY02355.1 hypothetical protein MMSR116_11070 [Methylobacterium mesophilicum SR1.6/6]
MNAPHPIRVQYGALALAPDPEPLPSMSEAIGRLETSLAILDQIAESALSAVHHLGRATMAGAGLRSDCARLEDVAAKLADVARRTEAARARVSGKLMGVP